MHLMESWGIFLALILAASVPLRAQQANAVLHGVLRGSDGNPVPRATIELSRISPPSPGAKAFHVQLTTDSGGAFHSELSPGDYTLSISSGGRTAKSDQLIRVRPGQALDLSIVLSGEQIRIATNAAAPAQGTPPVQVTASATGEAKLSSQQVSSLPLNKRDFSQLLTLAAGTATDTNGAANFTQQFAVNGQRGTTAVFAMDGIDTTDPELGGATFANFNVDAIQEIRSDSGVMPASIGEGAAGSTNVITKSGAAGVHGDAFEFLRNSALDARNFFDRRNLAQPGRVPPFRRNEFGFTNGGPLALPGIYNGRGRTYYFGEYQGFRQVLSTTQVLSVPSMAERQGLDTTAFRGDTLYVPINPQIAPILQAYPSPNDPEGAYGGRTYATSSKVTTNSDQFSIRIDHRPSEKSSVYGRFSFNQNTGPTTNPSQTAIDPDFAVLFFDHQRNAGLHWTHAFTGNVVSDSSFGFIRSTPLFTTVDRTQPGMLFGDGLYEPFNSASGQNYGAWGNLLQLRQSFTWVHNQHNFQMGFEARLNVDTTIFALNPNGQYTFGGGAAYSPVTILSASGRHNIQPGDPLPDSLTGFLTATPYLFATVLAGPQFPQGARMDEAAIRRNAYNWYFQDSWKISPRLSLDYGLRYEYNGVIGEAHHLTSAPRILGPDGKPAPFWEPGAQQTFLINPQPGYQPDWNGWGPRISLAWRASSRTTIRAGGAITTILPNLFADNAITGSIPYVLLPQFTASPGAPVPFTNGIANLVAPQAYTPQGQLIFSGPSTKVPANTVLDFDRLSADLAALSPGHQPQAMQVMAQGQDFSNGYIETFTAGVSHDFGDLKFNASYVGTVGVRLVNVIFPNAYAGASPSFARFTRFDSAGNVIGGYGMEAMVGNPSHSTFHSVEADVSKTSSRFGTGFQGSYTFSKSLDTSSTVFSGFGGSGGTVLQPNPADPWNWGNEKAPSTFDITHVFALSLIQALPFEQVPVIRSLGRLASGWVFLSITTLTTGPPFTVVSGIQQTGFGNGGGDRPDQIARPDFSTSRTVREDYFGEGAQNADFFSIPINVPGGTGPNQGRLGTLGRDTFRGPGFHNLDVALMKDTVFGRRAGAEALTLQFRAEFFNAFNLVTFGLPNNILLGSGFGEISKTAGTSRQLQFSLKLLY